MNESLSRFFKRNADVTLHNCDREQIHLCGLVQQGTGLLVLNSSGAQIVGVSQNIDTFLDKPTDAIIGMPLMDICPDIATELVEREDVDGDTYRILDAQLDVGGSIYDVLTHIHDGRRFVEFLPNTQPAPVLARKRMRLCGAACAQIIGAVSFEEAMQVAADAVRNLTGLDRVKIYQFLPDWSGEVVAESRNNKLSAMIGLNFPDSDIPKQVRDLMTIVPVRIIVDVEDNNVPIRALPDAADQLDLTWVASRSSSSMHTAYLRNIGAKSSFSCSLIEKGKLWGLIACHHSEPHTVPADSWTLAQEIAMALMLRHDQQERTEKADMIARLRQIENKFAAQLRQSGEVEDVIKMLVPVLQKFLRADGFAYLYGQNMHTSGETPPPDFIRKLIHWAKDNIGEEDQFQSVALHKNFPDAKDHMRVACGVLIQPIVMHRVCQLVWFRGPVTRHVAWAGRPDTKVVTDTRTAATLGPRTSFDKWVEEHNDQSLSWADAELEAAREIFQEFLDIITSQLLLKQENSSLKKFAHTAAHDITAPLRGISAALQWMEEDSADPQAVQGHRNLAIQQAQKLQRLTESLLEITLLQEQGASFQNSDLAASLDEACTVLAHQINEVSAQIKVGRLPRCRAAPDLMVRVFMNVISNAIKYADSQDALVVDISAEEDATHHRILIADNGKGIAPQYADRIFHPSERLVSDACVEGSGFGLAICKEIVQMHSGRIFVDPNFSSGARFVIELPKAVA